MRFFVAIYHLPPLLFFKINYPIIYICVCVCVCVGALGRQLSPEHTTRSIESNLSRAMPATIRSKILVFPFPIQKYKHRIIQKYSFACYFLMGVKLGLSQ